MFQYKFKLIVSKSTEKNLDLFLSVCRELYNAAIEERTKAWEANKTFISYYDQQNQLPEIRTIREDVALVYAQVLQEALRRVDKSFVRYFKGKKDNKNVGYPKYKGISGYTSFTYPQRGFKLSNKNLWLSKIGKLKVRLSQSVQGKIKTCTIKKQVDGWFVIFHTDFVKPQTSLATKTVGIDLGIEQFATLSDEIRIPNPRFYQKVEPEIKKLHRKLSRQTKYSKNYQITRKKLNKIFTKITNQREDFLHKISTWLVQNYKIIAIEDLTIQKLAQGYYSKQIHDVSWSKFIIKLSYKAIIEDTDLRKVNPAYTSQTCICGNIVEKTLYDRQHVCNQCGISVHRDLNAARVILQRAGLLPVEANANQ